MAESEKLRKCVDFEELRASMLIRVMPCGWCESDRGHRFLITSPAPVVIRALPGGYAGMVGPGWNHEPTHACGDSPLAVTAYTVASGRVYIIETGVDKETTRETTRELERVR